MSCKPTFETIKRSNQESEILNNKLKSYLMESMTTTESKTNQNSFFTSAESEGISLLKKKRKNSDLNLSNEQMKVSEKKNEMLFSPYTTDAKITSYFQQKKSSSYKKSATKPEDSQLVSGGKLDFVKRLNFDNFDDEEMTQKLPKEKISHLETKNEFSKQLGFMKEEKKDSSPCHVINPKSTKLSKDASPVKKTLQNYPGFKISKKTKEMIDSVFKISSQDKIIINEKFSENLNLNFSGIVKKIKNNNLKTKISSPKKNAPYSHQPELIQKVNKLLESDSMKERYEELLKRELMLPCHYKTLLKKLILLDLTLNLIKQNADLIMSNEKIIKTRLMMNPCSDLRSINKIMLTNFNSYLTQEDFQKILFIAPHFFIYKWEKANRSPSSSPTKQNHLLSNESSLVIDFPVDIEKRLEKTYDEQTNFSSLQTFPFIPIKSPLDKTLLEKRSALFKKVLLHLTNEHHRNFIKLKGIKTTLNPFKHRTWHSEFSVHEVKDVELFKLISKPKC